MAWPQLANNMPRYIEGNGSSTLTDNRIRVNLPYLRNMQADFDDIRWNNADGDTLKYQLISKTDGVSAVVDVEVDSIPPEGCIIYLFWGDSSLSSASEDISSDTLYSGTSYFLESTFYTHDNRGFKPPFGARLRRDFPWPRWPMGCWLFNEGSGDTVYDLSGNGNHGTIHGGCTWEEGGLKFDGSSGYVSLGQDPDIVDILKDTDAKATFIFFGKIEDVTNKQWLFSCKSTGGYDLRIYPFYDYMLFELWDDGGGFFGVKTDIALASGENIPQVLVASVDRNNGYSGYKNGTLQHSRAADTGTTYTANPLKLGVSGTTYTKMTLQLLIIIPAALDSGLIKYLSAFPFSEQVWEWGNLPF